VLILGAEPVILQFGVDSNGYGVEDSHELSLAPRGKRGKGTKLDRAQHALSGRATPPFRRVARVTPCRIQLSEIMIRNQFLLALGVLETQVQTHGIHLWTNGAIATVEYDSRRCARFHL
jgi:hypothetical protein